MGDFNFIPQSEEYDRIVGPLSPEYGRVHNLEGFVDSWVAAGHDERAGVTCDGGKRIDDIFIPAALHHRVARSWIDEAAQGSDHQPVWTELNGA